MGGHLRGHRPRRRSTENSVPATPSSVGVDRIRRLQPPPHPFRQVSSRPMSCAQCVFCVCLQTFVTFAFLITTLIISFLENVYFTSLILCLNMYLFMYAFFYITVYKYTDTSIQVYTIYSILILSSQHLGPNSAQFRSFLSTILPIVFIQIVLPFTLCPYIREQMEGD